MEHKRTIPEALVFGTMAGLLAYMLTGLPAAAAALLLCALTAILADRFCRVIGFVPAAAATVTAAVLHSRFMTECALCADELSYRTAMHAHRLYSPVSGTADSAPLVLFLACGIACGIYTALGAKGFGVTASAAAVTAELFTAAPKAPLCALIAVTAASFLFGQKNARSLMLTALTVLLAMPAVFLKFPAAPPKGEVTASGGLPLYLAQEYEQPQLNKSQYARSSAIFAALTDRGFDPRLQTAQLLAATGSELSADVVTAPEGFTPAGVCTGTLSHDTTDSFDGTDYTVCRELGDNVFRLMAKLRPSDYTDCEALYREYVFAAYGSLSADEQKRMDEQFSIDGSLPLDRKLAAVKSGINSHLKDENDRTALTVTLARSCGIAARQVSGVYFKAMPQSGKADLSDGEYRSWAEVYIDGAGWVVFETRPDYESASPLLPEGISAEGGRSASESAEQYIYAAAPPRTAAEIRPETEHFSFSPAMAAVPAGAVILLILAGRIRALARSAKRRSRTKTAALTAAHRQGIELAALTLGIETSLPPEKFAEKLDGLLYSRFNASEKAFERMRFSGRPADAADVKAAEKFYEEALRRAKKQGFAKSLARRLTGLY